MPNSVFRESWMKRLQRKLDDYTHSYHPSRHPDLNSDRYQCQYR